MGSDKVFNISKTKDYEVEVPNIVNTLLMKNLPDPGGLRPVMYVKLPHLVPSTEVMGSMSFC